MKLSIVHIVIAGVLVATGVAAGAQAALSADQQARIDQVVQQTLQATGTPGASIAIVRDAQIVYERAYGMGRLTPPTPASTAMRYGIGSVSKQFTAAAVLMLAEEGRLSLDDPVGRWLPELARAQDVTIRQLLSMTAGYRDYWPQDYVFTEMREPITPQALLDRWARGAPDFEPGTDWQYTSTNYVIAGLIVERVSGQRLFDFLRERIFRPLGMHSVHDADVAPLGDQDAQGLMRHALGPLRPAPKEAPGWLYAMGNLAMTAHDLARWNISVMRQSLLQPASYRAQQATTLLNNGLPTSYGLGVYVVPVDGRRLIAHAGLPSGYGAVSRIFPDERVAIVVLVNIYPGAARPAPRMASGIAAVLLEPRDAAGGPALEQARRLFAGLQQGQIDRALLTAHAKAYFDDTVLADHASSLGPLGTPTAFQQTELASRGGMVVRTYEIRFPGRALRLITQTWPDGRIEQFLVEPSE